MLFRSGSFVQTGANLTGMSSSASDYQCVYGMLTTEGTGTISWDNNSEGGYLAIREKVTDTHIQYHNKTIIIGVTIEFSGDIYSIIIPENVNLTNSEIITVRKDFIIEKDGKYTHNDKPLYFISSDDNVYASGKISDSNSTLSNLGNVLIC